MNKIGSCVLHFYKDEFIYNGSWNTVNQVEIFVNTDEWTGPTLRKHLDNNVPPGWMKGVRVWNNKYSIRVTCSSWDSFLAVHKELTKLETDD